MPVIFRFWRLPLYLEEDVLYNDVGFVVRHRTGLGCGYIGCVTDHIDIVVVSGLQSTCIGIDKTHGVTETAVRYHPCAGVQRDGNKKVIGNRITRHGFDG
ncbi:MAG: hypothetical protein OER74_16655, partial [Desulfobacteraceae bacterium]|nr:hypothetical protein [Desulfobacteraceae bacterium]